MMFGLLFTLPDASTTMNGLGDYSKPVVTDFLPVIYVIGGIVLGLLITRFIIGMLQNSHHTSHK